MKKKYIFIGLLVFIGVISISFYALRNIQHEPVTAMSTSREFLNLMMADKLEQAYSLTNKNTIVGTTVEDFKRKVYKEWTRHGGNPGCKITLGNIFPKQSWGNRLRRYLKGGTGEMNWIYVNYYVCRIPFGITLKSDHNGDWRVTNFQSHAE